MDIQPADVTVTIDGSTFIRAQAGQVTITSANVTINGNTSIVGATTIRGNVGVTGNTTLTGALSVAGDITVTGSVDGVDVSSHTHGGVMPGGGTTEGPS